MAKKYTRFLGGPWTYQNHAFNHCIKTMKFRVGDSIGHYYRDIPGSEYMKWKESEKRWYLIDSDASVSKEKLEKLGCWGVVESTIHWSKSNGDKPAKLVRRVGIDIDSPTAAFELCYAEYITYISPYTYQDFAQFRSSFQ